MRIVITVNSETDDGYEATQYPIIYTSIEALKAYIQAHIDLVVPMMNHKNAIQQQIYDLRRSTLEKHVLPADVAETNRKIAELTPILLEASDAIRNNSTINIDGTDFDITELMPARGINRSGGEYIVEPSIISVDEWFNYRT